MEKRVLGKTGEKLSIVGMGGVLLSGEKQSDADRLVSEAVETGINYFDVAPTYGNAEELLGPALKSYRNSVFLAAKTTKRTKQDAAEELAQTLKRLKTDHLDLYQLHGVSKMEEVQQILGPGGALEAFVEAREKGQTRYLGFSCHLEQAALALIESFEFDSVLFPINCVCWLNGNFGPRLVEKAREHGMGILAIKALAKANWPSKENRRWTKCWYEPFDTEKEIRSAVRFTLSLPVTAIVPSGHEELFRMACDAAEDFEPLSDDELKHLKDSLSGLEAIFTA